MWNAISNYFLGTWEMNHCFPLSTMGKIYIKDVLTCYLYDGEFKITHVLKKRYLKGMKFLWKYLPKKNLLKKTCWALVWRVHHYYIHPGILHNGHLALNPSFLTNPWKQKPKPSEKRMAPIMAGKKWIKWSLVVIGKPWIHCSSLT